MGPGGGFPAGYCIGQYTVKKGYRFSQTSLAGNNSRPGIIWLVKFRMGTGKTITFFTVYIKLTKKEQKPKVVFKLTNEFAVSCYDRK